MPFEKNPPLTYEIVKSRSTEPYGALWDLSFHDMTAAEAVELIVVMRRLQKMREGSITSTAAMVEFLNSADDGFSNRGRADGG